MVVVKLKKPREIFHYAFAVEWLARSVARKGGKVGRRVAKSRRDDQRMVSLVQFAVGKLNQFVRD